MITVIMSLSLALVLLLATTEYVLAADILVNLPNGVIRGKEALSTNNKTYFAFQKIPYAAPPIGDLRFKPPVPPENWEGILDTSEDITAVCYHVAETLEAETEDCLHINVYTPQIPDDNNESPALPVMFYIHGGGFVGGECTFAICGPEFLIEEEVIVVTIHYRLGPFGFLSTQDLVLPGNNGLKDQLLALKWAHDNIELFGGDPSRITIFGESAGSASVTYQLLNMKSEGLYWGAIAQSGSFLSPWAFQRNPVDIAFRTAAAINDTFETNRNSQDLLDYLMSVPADLIDYASTQIFETFANRQITHGYFYAPVIEPEHDEAFITQKMYGSLKNGDIVKVPLMMGTTSEESVGDLIDVPRFRRYLQALDQNIYVLVPEDMRIEDPDRMKEVGQHIRDFYTRGVSLDNNIAGAIKFESDSSFTRALLKHAELYSQYADVYFYQFSYDGPMGNFSIVIDGAGRVSHAEDVLYIFRRNTPEYDNTDPSKFPESDSLAKSRVLRLWSNFAKTLNPTPEPEDLLQNVTWPEAFSGARKKANGDFLFLDIGNDLQVMNHLKAEAYKMWTDLYDSLGFDDFDTY